MWKKKKKEVQNKQQIMSKVMLNIRGLWFKTRTQVCGQQTWVAKRPKRLALDRWVRRTTAFAKILGEMKY